MKYHNGQKVQDKRDFIRGRVVDFFEQDDTKYWIAHNNGIATFLESQLEPVPEARLGDFCRRVWSCICNDWISAFVIFVIGVFGGLLL